MKAWMSPKQLACTWLMTSNLDHHLLAECHTGDCPVFALKACLERALCANRLIQDVMNLSRTGVCTFWPTRSSVWLKHPISTRCGYKIFSCIIATLLMFNPSWSKQRAWLNDRVLRSSSHVLTLLHTWALLPTEVVKAVVQRSNQQ